MSDKVFLVMCEYFVQGNKKPYYQIFECFETERQADEFAELCNDKSQKTQDQLDIYEYFNERYYVTQWTVRR